MRPKERIEAVLTLCCLIVCLAFLIFLACGCSTFKASYQTETFNVKNPDIKTVSGWDVWRGSVLTKSSAENVAVKYGDVEVDVNKYAQSGDSKMVDAIGSAIVNGILAYATYGGAPAVKSAVMATLKGAVTNCAPDVCAPVLDDACKPK